MHSTHWNQPSLNPAFRRVDIPSLMYRLIYLSHAVSPQALALSTVVVAMRAVTRESIAHA